MSGNFTLTPKLGLYKPTFNSDVDAWGGHWNANADTLDGLLPVAGGTMTGPLNYTATGATTSRSAQDRAADWINVEDFGAKLDGTTDDTPALNAALTASQPDSTIYMSHGSGHIHYTGASITSPGPAGMVHWLLDGPLADGNAVITGFLGTSRIHKGDLVENFHGGTKYLTVASAAPDMYGVLRLDYNLRAGAAAGTPGGVATILRVNTQDNAASLVSQWGIHVLMDSYANPSSGASAWPQNVGISSTVYKHGYGWVAGHHVGVSDLQNVDSLTGGTMLGMEMGLHVNGADNGFNSGTIGNQGIRIGIKVGIDQNVVDAGVQGEVGWAFHATGGGNTRFRSVLGVSTGVITYQVIDTRGATMAPAGYTDPIAALRMQAGQIIDFNGSTTDARGNAGNYLKYDTASGKLLYYVGGVARWSVDASGNMRCAGTVTGSVTP